MQERHNNREQYFKELATTCEKYFIPYIQQWHKVEAGMNILEIGCGEGGNLLPFSRMGCKVTGVDIAACRIDEARDFFKREQAEGVFIADDIFNQTDLQHQYDIIICHDVIEHLYNKDIFMSRIGAYLNDGGVIFMSFPAWMMPFGGHQQICHNKLLSHLPFVHLLPRALYKGVINMFGEDKGCLDELMSIKSTQMTIENFESLLKKANLAIHNKVLWFVNPHYQTKFGLTPRKLCAPFSSIPYVRDFFSTSCFYILKNR